MLTRNRQYLLVLLVVLLLNSCQQPRQEPDAALQEIAHGSFVDKGGQQTSGSYRILRAGDDLRLVLSEDFRTDEGPDLHVILSPTVVEEAVNENALAEGAEVVGLLESFAGEQVYDLSVALDVLQYRSVLIHCVEFSHLYGAAPVQ
jgi:hypothetical protein